MCIFKIKNNNGINADAIKIKQILSENNSSHARGLICMGVKPSILPDIKMITKETKKPFIKNMNLFLIDILFFFISNF